MKLEKQIDVAKSKIISPEFSKFSKVKRKRLKRRLKSLEIRKKKFEKIIKKNSLLNNNSGSKNNEVEKILKDSSSEDEDGISNSEEDEDEDEDKNENEDENEDEMKESKVNQLEKNNSSVDSDNCFNKSSSDNNNNNKVNDNKSNNNNSQKNNNITNNESDALVLKNLIKDENFKYYYQRYRLFTKFDEGIILDEESWFSVTPELIAQHIAERCRCGTIIDLFCGAGGNIIQFSFTCNYVIAIDMDPVKLMMAKHNSLVYGHTPQNTNIEFINSDSTRLSNLKADVVFLSPPWGGPNYINSQIFYIDSMVPNGFDIFRNALKVTPNIAYFLPRNTSKSDIAKLCLISKENGGSEECEVEENYINDKLKTITLYFGALMNNNKYYN